VASTLGLCITVRGSRKTRGPEWTKIHANLAGRRGKNEPLARPEDAAEPGSRDGFHEAAEFWFLAVGGDSATKGMPTGGLVAGRFADRTQFPLSRCDLFWLRGYLAPAGDLPFVHYCAWIAEICAEA